VAAALVLLVVLLGGLVMMSGQNAAEKPKPAQHGLGEDQPSRSGPVATMGERSRAPDGGTVQIGQAGSDADMRFQVNSLSCGKKQIGAEPLTLTANGTFCVADVRLTNAGSEPHAISFGDQKLYDTKGKSYRSVKYAASSFPGQYLFDQIQPNQTVSGPIIFDIPESAAADHLELHGDDSGKGLTVKL